MTGVKIRFCCYGLVVMLVALSGCATVGLGILGSGAGMLTGHSVAYTLDGFVSRTFTAPMPEVESATRRALERMGLRVDAVAQIDHGKAFRAQALDREIEIELERVSASATRVRTVAKQGFFIKDRATAEEILAQTEKALVGSGAPLNSPSVLARRR